MENTESPWNPEGFRCVWNVTAVYVIGLGLFSPVMDMRDVSSWNNADATDLSSVFAQGFPLRPRHCPEECQVLWFLLLSGVTSNYQTNVSVSPGDCKNIFSVAFRSSPGLSCKLISWVHDEGNKIMNTTCNVSIFPDIYGSESTEATLTPDEESDLLWQPPKITALCPKTLEMGFQCLLQSQRTVWIRHFFWTNSEDFEHDWFAV